MAALLCEMTSWPPSWNVCRHIQNPMRSYLKNNPMPKFILTRFETTEPYWAFLKSVAPIRTTTRRRRKTLQAGSQDKGSTISNSVISITVAKLDKI